MAGTPPSLDALSSLISDTTLSKSFQLSSLVVLAYDHVLTLPIEVEKIWRRRFSGVTLLFLANRYWTLFNLIWDVEAVQDRNFVGKICRYTAAIQPGGSIATVAVCEIVMIIRVVAFWDQDKIVMTILAILWMGQLTISSIGISTGHFMEVHVPPNLHACVFLNGESVLFPMTWIAALLTSATTFGLTIYRSILREIKPNKETPILRIMLLDGIIYFAIIFLANLINTLVYFLANDNLRTLTAPFTTVITSIMVSRLMLNLRAAADSNCLITTIDSAARKSQPLMFIQRTITDLGEGVGEEKLTEEWELDEDGDPSTIPLSTLDRGGEQ